jgi:hypothetical protein
MRLSNYQLHVAASLLLDKNGASAAMIDQLQKWGGCESAAKANRAIREAAVMVTGDNAFPPTTTTSDGEVQVPLRLVSADNADVQTSTGTNYSRICISELDSGLSFTQAEKQRYEESYFWGAGGMPLPSTDTCTDIDLSKQDIAVIEAERDAYNTFALLKACIAPLSHDAGAEDEAGGREVRVNDQVTTFSDMYARSVTGKVVSVSGTGVTRMCKVEIKLNSSTEGFDETEQVEVPFATVKHATKVRRRP